MGYIVQICIETIEDMQTKNPIPPFDIKEIVRVLYEMIAEDSPDASKAFLSGAREAVFREVFLFHYPAFRQRLYRCFPELDEEEELVCMLTALGASVEEIAELTCFPPIQVRQLYTSVCRKLDVTEKRKMRTLMKKLLS